MPDCLEIARYCDRHLAIDDVTDWPGAVNGLQVENRGPIRRIAATVDASLSTIRLAVARKSDLLIVHHGLFWKPIQPWTGKRAELIRLLVTANLGVYSSHLPLDRHPSLGNNALLVKALGFRKSVPFFDHKGVPIGTRVNSRLDRKTLKKRLESAVGGSVTMIPGGPASCRRIGVLTGGGGGDLHVAAAEGVDTFITGEGPHWSFAAAEELGLNVFYAGHYATETFGVKALAAHLASKFRLEWEFIDYPTGL